MRIGIDLGGTKIAAIALDADDRVMQQMRVPTPAGDYAATLAAIQRLVRGLEDKRGMPASVGIATPGAISPASGRIKNANSVCLNGQPLQADLQALLKRPVRMANDADCFALSEACDGAAADARVVFGVIIGTGTGGGVVVNGHLLAGPNAVAGEWGHNPLPWMRADERPGPACYCGQQGCIETFLSGPGLARDYRAATGAAQDAVDIVARADAGEPAAEACLQRYEDRLARALASVINLLDPNVIVLGGGLSNIPRLYQNVPQRWGRYVFSGGAENEPVCTRLCPPIHGDASGVRGAARLWPAVLES